MSLAPTLRWALHRQADMAKPSKMAQKSLLVRWLMRRPLACGFHCFLERLLLGMGNSPKDASLKQCERFLPRHSPVQRVLTNRETQHGGKCMGPACARIQTLRRPGCRL